MTSETHSNYPAPRVNADSEPFWKASAQGRFLFKLCQKCGHPHFPPRYLCPKCWSDRLEWVESKGKGTVYSLTIMRRAPIPEFAKRVPYVVALIDLNEGPRIMANIVGIGALDVKIGENVSVCFESRAEGMQVPQFQRDL